MSIELNLRFPWFNQVLVKFDDDETESLAFQNPFETNDFADMVWHLETYAAHYITDVDIARAEKIAERLTVFGEALFDAVFSDRNASC